MQRVADYLSDWIDREVRLSGGLGVVFGMSGGLDSSVVAALSKRIFPDACLGVIMPCHSEPEDARDAELVAERFEVATRTVDLTPVYDVLLAQLGEADEQLPQSRMPAANLKPRLRMTTLYAFANLLGYRVLGAGNRSELAVGYFTKHGDSGVDLQPIAGLTKSQVRALAEYLDVPRRVIDKPPSAGLWAGQTDEAELGLTYEELDSYLMGARGPHAQLIEAMHDATQHKRELPKAAPFPDEGGTGKTPGPRGR